MNGRADRDADAGGVETRTDGVVRAAHETECDGLTLADRTALVKSPTCGRRPRVFEAGRVSPCTMEPTRRWLFAARAYTSDDLLPM